MHSVTWVALRLLPQQVHLGIKAQYIITIRNARDILIEQMRRFHRLSISFRLLLHLLFALWPLDQRLDMYGIGFRQLS